MYQDGDTPRDRQKVDVAEEDREPHDGATKPALVLAAAHHRGRSTPSPLGPGRYRHVDRAERLVVPGHELVEDLRGNQRKSERLVIPRRELQAVSVHGRPEVIRGNHR